MITTNKFLTLLMITLMAALSFSQTYQELYDDAINLYKNKEYESSIAKFKEIADGDFTQLQKNTGKYFAAIFVWLRTQNLDKTNRYSKEIDSFLELIEEDKNNITPVIYYTSLQRLILKYFYIDRNYDQVISLEDKILYSDSSEYDNCIVATKAYCFERLADAYSKKYQFNDTARIYLLYPERLKNYFSYIKKSFFNMPWNVVSKEEAIIYLNKIIMIAPVNEETAEFLGQVKSKLEVIK